MEMTMNIKNILLVSLLLISSLFGSTVYVHVSVDGAGSGDGTSWTNAMPEPNFYTKITDNSAATDTVYYIKEGSYALTGAVTCLPAATQLLPIKLVGVKAETTHTGADVVYADYAFGTDRPTIACAAFQFTANTSYVIENIIITATGTSDGLKLGNYNIVINCFSTNISSTASKSAFYGGTGCNFIQCQGVSTNGYAFRSGAQSIFDSCYAHDSNVAVSCNTANTVANCVVDTCTYGISCGALANCHVLGNTIYNCGTGISCSTAYAFVGVNNIISQCTTGASWTAAAPDSFWGGNLWNNTTDVTNVTKGMTDVSVAVGTTVLTDPANGNFTLKTGDMTARKTGLQLTTNDGLAVAGLHWNIGADQTDDLPAAAAVLEADYVDGTQGTYHVCEVGEVLNIVNFGAASAQIGTYDGPAASEVWHAYTFGVGAIAGTFDAGDITVTNGDAATLTAPDIKLDVVVDPTGANITGTASGSGISTAWVGSN